MNRMVVTRQLARQNLAFWGTGGVSTRNRAYGFLPAFQDAETGHTALARFADGTPAPMHVLDGLPVEWIVRRDSAGEVAAIKETVVAGFLFRGRFYSREQAADAVLH